MNEEAAFKRRRRRVASIVARLTGNVYNRPGFVWEVVGEGIHVDFDKETHTVTYTLKVHEVPKP